MTETLTPETTEQIAEKFTATQAEAIPITWEHAIVSLHIKFRKMAPSTAATLIQQVINDRIGNVIVLEGQWAGLQPAQAPVQHVSADPAENPADSVANAGSPLIEKLLDAEEGDAS